MTYALCFALLVVVIIGCEPSEDSTDRQVAIAFAAWTVVVVCLAVLAVVSVKGWP